LIAQERGLQIVHQIPAGMAGLVLADKDRLNQVLNNLIGNAIKFSPDGGTIQVSLHEVEGKVQVVVSDEGIGMPADQVHRIFDRFYQVDGSSRRRFSGTGLGLAIAKRILEAHDGVIWVESELDKGSTFYFTLPQLLPLAEVV
jgi:signal transduction histidine kinase